MKSHPPATPFGVPRLITEQDPPQFPCWLWNPREGQWWKYCKTHQPTRFVRDCTHWLPSRSEMPTIIAPALSHKRTILEIGDELATEAERYIDIGWDLAHESKRLTELIKEYRLTRAKKSEE